MSNTEQLETIVAAAEQVRKADIELTLANRNPSPSIYVQRNALRGAENKLQELLPVATVLALVAAVEAGAADSRRLDALTQGIESGHVAFEDDPCVFCEVDEDECDGDSDDCRKNLHGKDFFRVWKTVDQASKSGVLIETTDPRAAADAILAAREATP